jgi:hypothetical protein
VRNSIAISFLLLASSAFAQVGGRSSFEFVNLSASARLTALGGVNVSLTDRDLNFFAANPALAGDSLAGTASVNYQFYVADIGHAGVAYAHRSKKVGTIMFGIQHMGYGEIQGYDASGIETQKFTSGETALMVGKSHQLGNFRLGASIKGVFSNLAGYRASALMFDLGGVFVHPEKAITVGMAIKNAGFQLGSYIGDGRSTLPFDVQLGATMKPEHMPIRFSFTAFNLSRPDVTYFDPASGNEKPGTFQKIVSHLNMGGELLLHKNVNILFGYNFLTHQALKLTEGGGGAGISFGFSAHIKTVEFVFSRGTLVAGNAGYAFTLSSRLNKSITRRQ